ncbi:hypothetical protein DFH11DRAFT_1563786 [Phellopilus nigrolimitatus]|nr:hypothetical protein DFH11DRAFT_1563786 [Phellopilus nigrolimitatus]
MSERETNRLQRGMVDGCFEEGHYQQGIATLDQLRLQNLRPSPSHVRELIYIALYPPPAKVVQKNKGKKREYRPGISSPSKHHLQHTSRLNKQVYIPPPEASEASWQLLQNLATTTNMPESLLRAVPCYPLSELELVFAPRSISAEMFRCVDTGEDLDADIAKRAAALKDCKDCWNMLRADVVVRQDVPIQIKGDPFCDDPEDGFGENDSASMVIGKYSWRLLSWFIRLFEIDQALVDECRSDRFSVFLLSQIKPALMSVNEPRMAADPPLEIIFTCYSQADRWRRELGKRLMSLLVDLTSCSCFSPSLFLTSTSTRLLACSSDLLSVFLNDLPSSNRGLAVKLAICDRFLTQSMRGATGTDSDSKGAKTHTRPQARRAQPLPSQRIEPESPTKSHALARSRDNSYPWALPTAQRVLQLLGPESSIRSPSKACLNRLVGLYHLVAAFGAMRAVDGAENETERSWVDALLDGQLEKDVQDSFSADRLSEDDRRVVHAMRSLLIEMCARWKKGCI